MTVKELIEELKQFPDDWRVYYYDRTREELEVTEAAEIQFYDDEENEAEKGVLLDNQ